jgi:hypothetical protein
MVEYIRPVINLKGEKGGERERERMRGSFPFVLADLFPCCWLMVETPFAVAPLDFS